MLRLDVRALLSLCAVLAVPILATADDLPPATGPAHSAVFHMTSRSREKAQDDWTFSSEDTITISVLAKVKLSRWDYKSDGHSVLNDQVGRYATTFGGKNPANVAYRSQAPFTPIGWEFGFETLTKVNDNKPEILGKASIAGKECTRIRFTSEQYGEPELCVTKTGIVLRFANRSSTAETTYEAVSLDESAPDEKLFSVPTGTRVEDRGGPRRPKIF